MGLINQQKNIHHSFNEHKKLTSFILGIKKEASIALITDAGTPSISDPASLLVFVNQ